MSSPAPLDVFDCPLDGINLIEASAGTGKTWNICGLYLRLLLEQGLEARQILVVTFTNAATAELRERIRARIVETLDYLSDPGLAGGDPFVPRLMRALVEHRGLGPELIRNRLELALHSFDEAAIFTIHGFCQRALADTPFAAGLPMRLETLRDDAELRLAAVQDFWRRRIAGDALPEALAAYLDQQGDSPEKFAGLLEQLLEKPLAQVRWPAGSEAPPSPDAAAVHDACAEARACWSRERQQIVDTLATGRTQLNGQTYTQAALAKAVASWDALFQADDALAPPGEKLELLTGGKLKARTRNDCVTPTHDFFVLADDYLTRRQALEQALLLNRARLLRDLAEAAGADLAAGKRALRVVTFDDMLQNLHQRLTGGSHPWLAPALKSRFPAALIDEFQDTDPLQFGIFQAIYGAGDVPVFLVGDPKQAIYSFRNADLPTYLQAKARAGREYSLADNQRASRPLIDALNGLFGGHGQAFMLPGLNYRAVAFGARPRKAFIDRSEPRGDLHVWLLHGEGAEPPLKKVARQAATGATAAEIARLLAAAARGEISLDGAALAPGDIAVLVRSHSQGSEMKQALARLGVGSVELSQASIYQSADAEEVERVLRAVLEPGRPDLARAALATELMGLDAPAIAALTQDAPGLSACMAGFDELRGLWLQRGFGVMYRRLLARERVAERLLARPDGERRLTNFLHLGESLHQASETHASPEVLLRHLEAQRRDSSGDEALQLRLESDQNLVQIVTVHKAKGLEYPVVFCPYLWDGHAHGGRRDRTGKAYHDEAGRPVLDLRGDTLDATEQQAIDAGIRLEQAAETLRLIYVALTRAVHRCYLVAGGYTSQAFGRPSAGESTRSLLNWLVAGAGHQPGDWLKAKLEPAGIIRHWQALDGRPGIRVAPLPAAPGRPLAPADVGAAALSVPPPPAIPGAWRISSFSGLSHGAVHEQAASDHDARVQAPAFVLPAELPEADILRFPRGAEAGDCIHAVFEHIDFRDAQTWPPAIELALRQHPQRLPGRVDGAQQALLGRMLHGLVARVLSTELRPGLRLDTVSRQRRLTELEFNLPARNLAPAELNDSLKALGYPGPRLGFSTLRGYLKGFIDLVFEHDGRFYVLDWKSNHLGHDPAAYGAAGLAEAMAEHGYHLQALLYALALERYLGQRLPDYDFARHFGGVLYLFVRGVRPDWRDPAGQPAGVYFHKPEAATLARLNTLLDRP